MFSFARCWSIAGRVVVVPGGGRLMERGSGEGGRGLGKPDGVGAAVGGTPLASGAWGRGNDKRVSAG